MTHAKRLAMLAPLLLAGCAAGSYCEGDQNYQDAQSVPVLKPVEGLRLTESSSALKVPPEPGETVPYGDRYKDADGDEAVRCLDQPPALPPPKEEAPQG